MLPLAAATLGVFLADQWSKLVVRAHAIRPVSLGPALRLRVVSVRRAAYGRPLRRVGLVLTWSVAVMAAGLLYRSGDAFQNPAALWGLGAAFGGAAGNLADILRRRAVVDFIDLGWWPVFNLADVGIVVGLVVAFWPWN